MYHIFHEDFYKLYDASVDEFVDYFYSKVAGISIIDVIFFMIILIELLIFMILNQML